MTADFEYRHPQLGDLIGLSREGGSIVQFRGVPYASIAARFRQCELAESLPSTPFDARQPGTYCPQPVLFHPPYWQGPVPVDYPKLKAAQQDEFSCLNLTITAPQAALDPVSLEELPVLVFIHGGAFLGGSTALTIAGREIFDATNLVHDSIKRGKPIIVVAINYRLGPLGFLASKELAEFNRAHDEPVGNYGLHDQRRALEWCNRFLGGFGADVDNVTIHGTSAGAVSCHYQCIFPERKFRRAILSSGTIVGLGPKGLDYHQDAFSQYLQKFASDAPVGQSPVELLQAVSVSEIVVPVLPGIFYPFVDGDWIPSGTLKSIEHIEEPPLLMIGACEAEQDVVDLLLVGQGTGRTQPIRTVLDTIKEMFNSNGMIVDSATFPFNYPGVVKAYSIPNALEDPSKELANWGALVADMAFRLAPVHTAALHKKSRVLLYEIQATNPFPNEPLTYNKANHGVNDVFLFDVAQDQVPKEHLEDYKGTVAQIQGAWLSFCYGEEPWRAVESDNRLGPVYKFGNGAGGKLCENLEELVGEQVAHRWTEVLKTCHEGGKLPVGV